MARKKDIPPRPYIDVRTEYSDSASNVVRKASDLAQAVRMVVNANAVNGPAKELLWEAAEAVSLAIYGDDR